ncbi:MAG TPA: class I SAM-dependent methyltransferase [Vineibacter sp.]|nr:class I SAM-dependent methyltransferase [Vineibacter sp.]
MTPSAVLSQYVDTVPSARNAIDAVSGWHQTLAASADVVAGTGIGYADIRMSWCLEQFGPITGLKVLELGPLEGMQTYLLDQANPELIHAVEANRLSFLRCLVTKELLGIKRARFLHGNFVPWLEQVDVTYDLIIASGVLYHMRDPVRLLELIAQRSNAIYIWTHYFSDAAMPQSDPRRSVFRGDAELVDFRGVRVALHRRSYHGAWRSTAYCGGIVDQHYWMEREGIEAVLRQLGFADIRTAHDQHDQANGPCISIFARRAGA